MELTKDALLIKQNADHDAIQTAHTCAYTMLNHSKKYFEICQEHARGEAREAYAEVQELLSKAILKAVKIDNGPPKGSIYPCA